MATENVDRFRAEFKRYKRNQPPPDLGDVIEFSCVEKHKAEISVLDAPPIPSREVAQQASLLGLKSPDQWQVYGLHCIPGVMIIPNPFLPGAQHYWVTRCVVDYPCHPNVCNLDAHMTREGRGQLWSPGCDGMMKKLTWVTLGYHYNWSTKEYSPSNHSEFPIDLSYLSSFILHSLGFHQFKPEAAIVNYYQLGATLSGHTDHSEDDLTAPLISMSFSQSAVFLIGGQTKDITPKAMFIHSGDIVVMSAQSRLAYHGVPKILSPTNHGSTGPSCLSEVELAQRIHQIQAMEPFCLAEMQKLDGAEPMNCVKAKKDNRSNFDFKDILNFDYHRLQTNWRYFEQYLATTRINVNIRQVYH